MNEEDLIFGTEPDRLMRLMRSGLEEDGAEAAADTRRTVQGDPLPEQPGTRVGRYKLLRILGEGGMGLVYLAEQEGAITRQVAVKVIKPGMDSKRVIARFETERQALALLDHPSVAQVYDAGTTEAGRPYFAMEYVKGSPITEYCDRHKLSIEDRLRLFQQVCAAVHHAHQKGIIHRDIKPSNILVSTEGDAAIPKIIDFGVAKATGKSLTERTLYTEDSQLLGTPEYMSPEQADRVNEDIDTRSDIYSLGVLLYELLTGVLPFDSDTLRTGGIEHVRKTIRETDPKTPSTQLTKLGDEAKLVAENRCTQVATLARRLRSELEWIPLKAMRKERSERYRSATELADDIENYLKGAPLIAGPPGAVYRFRKFVRRNATLSAAVLAVAATLLLGLVATTAMYLRAERAFEREARARAEAQAIVTFLTNDVLGSAQKVVGRDATAMDLLDAATEKLDEGVFKDQPLTESSVRFRLGNLMKELGYFDKAIPHLERVRQISMEHNGVGIHPHLIMNYLALAYFHSGELKRAETLFQQIAQEKENSHEPPGADLYPWVKLMLAKIYNIQARYEESERVCLETMHFQFRKGDAIRPSTRARLMQNLAHAYRAQGRYQQAEQVLIEALDIDKADPERLRDIQARLYLDQGHYEEVEAHFQEVIERHQQTLPGEGIHRYTLPTLSALAALYTKQGRFTEAESLFQDIRETQKEKLGEDHWETLKTFNDFGVLRREQQRYEEAESMLRQALEGRQRKLGPDHPACFESMHELGVLYIRQARYEDAEPLLLGAYNGHEAKLGPGHPHTIESLRQLVNLYESSDKPDEVTKWRARLAEDWDCYRLTRQHRDYSGISVSGTPIYAGPRLQPAYTSTTAYLPIPRKGPLHK